MSILADVVIVAVILLALIIGAKSGLLQSLAGVIVLVCSAIGASFAARFLADPLAQQLQPMLSDGLTEKLGQTGQSAAATVADARQMLEKFGFSGESLENLAKEIVRRVGETGQTMADTVVGTVTHSIAFAVVFVVVFILLLVVLSLLIKPLELATRLPGLHGLNTLGGGVLGFVDGVLLVFAAVWVLRRLQLVITPQLVEESTLLKFFVENSPLSLLTGL